MRDPHSITPREMNASLRNSILAGAIGVVFFMVVQNGPIPILLEQLGAGGIAIGLTATLFQLGMLVQIPSAFFAERLRSRKPFWAITTITARAALAIPGLYLLSPTVNPTTGIGLTLAAIAVFSFIAQTSGPTWFSWMAELVPEERRSDFWAKRQGVMMLVSVVSVAFVGWFLDFFPEHSFAGFGWALIIAAIMGVVDIVVHAWVIEPIASPVDRSLSAKNRVLQPLRNRDFLYFTLAMCVWFFGLGFFGPFMNVYLKTTFGITFTHLSAIQLAGMVSSVVSSFVGGRLIEKVGLRTYGLAMVVTVPLFSLVWFLLDGNAAGSLPLIGRAPQPVVLLCISSLLAGGVYAAVGLLQLNLLSALSPKEGKTMAMAAHWTLVGTLSALGPIAGGWVKDHFAAHPTGWTMPLGEPFSWFQVIVVIHMGMVWLIMFPLLLNIRKRDGEWPVRNAVADIFVLTPLRSVRNIYSFNAAASSVTVNTVKGAASAAGKIAARAAKDTGTIAIRALKETAEAAGRAGKESIEKEKRKKKEKRGPQD